MPRMTTRPQTLQGMAAAGAGALMVGLYTGHVGPHWLEFTRPALPITGLPRELQGRSLAQISDLHVVRESAIVYQPGRWSPATGSL
jgi:hypothetical protein